MSAILKCCKAFWKADRPVRMSSGHKIRELRSSNFREGEVGVALFV